MPYFDDDGNELNPNLVQKPTLCVACAKDDVEDEMMHILCNLTRLDHREGEEFVCHAYVPKFSTDTLDWT